MAGTTKANLMQTAVNAAASFVGALVGAGLIGDKAEAKSEFDAFRDDVFKTLEAQPSDAPSGGGGYKKSSGGGGGGGSTLTVESALDTVINNGKFAGETVRKVLGLSASEAAEYGYGEGDKSGRDYIKWLSTNEKNPFMARRAALVLEG